MAGLENHSCLEGRLEGRLAGRLAGRWLKVLDRIEVHRVMVEIDVDRQAAGLQERRKGYYPCLLGYISVRLARRNRGEGTESDGAFYVPDIL